MRRLVSIAAAFLAGLGLLWLGPGSSVGTAGTEGRLAAQHSRATILPRVQVATTQLPVGYPGEPYRVRLELIGGVPPFTTLLDPSRTNAPGFTLTTDGWVLGTPTAPGAYTLVVNVSDANDARRSPVRFSTSTLALVVSERPPLVVAARLPPLVAGRPLDLTLVSGGTPPYGIRAAQGSLPRGWRLVVGPRLSGVAELSGPYRVSLSATDALGRVSRAVISGIVRAIPGFDTRPNPLATPGRLNPLVTAHTLERTICSNDWLSAQTVELTLAEQRAVLRRYGLPPDARGYVLSHLVPAALGGEPHDLGNRWPQLRSRAGRMEQLEARLNARLCRGATTLATARREFRAAVERS
jgi:hypothetical protein